jgi:hypothetical protein
MWKCHSSFDDQLAGLWIRPSGTKLLAYKVTWPNHIRPCLWGYVKIMFTFHQYNTKKVQCILVQAWSLWTGHTAHGGGV